MNQCSDVQHHKQRFARIKGQENVILYFEETQYCDVFSPPKNLFKALDKKVKWDTAKIKQYCRIEIGILEKRPDHSMFKTSGTESC